MMSTEIFCMILLGTYGEGSSQKYGGCDLSKQALNVAALEEVASVIDNKAQINKQWLEKQGP